MISIIIIAAVAGIIGLTGRGQHNGARPHHAHLAPENEALLMYSRMTRG